MTCHNCILPLSRTHTDRTKGVPGDALPMHRGLGTHDYRNCWMDPKSLPCATSGTVRSTSIYVTWIGVVRATLTPVLFGAHDQHLAARAFHFSLFRRRVALSAACRRFSEQR